MEDFERTLRLILSNDNSERAHGEISLKVFAERHDFYKFLLYGLGLDDGRSCLSAIVFRQTYLESHKFKQLPLEIQQEIQKYLISHMGNDKTIGFLNNLGVAIITIFCLMSAEDQLKRFLDSIKAFNNPDLVLCYFDLVVKIWPDFVWNNHNSLNAVLWDFLFLDSAKSQITACKTMCYIFLVTKTSNLLFRDKVIEIIEKHKNHELLSSLLEVLSKTIEESPETFTAPAALLEPLIEIARNVKIPHSNRVSAVDLIISMNFRTFTLKNIQDLLSLAFVLMAEVEYYDDISAWSQEIKDNQAVYNDSFHLGKDLLAHLVELKKSHKCVNELINAHLLASHWVHQHAGIYAYGVFSLATSEYLSDFPRVFSCISSENPRIQWAALCTGSAIWAKYKDFERNGSSLNVLASFMKSPYVKVQNQAVVAATCFLQGAEASSFHLDEFLEVLYEILSNPVLTPCVYNEILALVAVLAEKMSAAFLPFSAKFISGLVNILASAMLSSIKSSAIKCLSIILCSCSSPSDAESLFLHIFSLYGKIDDTLDCAIIQSIPHFLVGMKESAIKHYEPAVGCVLAAVATDVKNQNFYEKSSSLQVLASFEHKGVEENACLNADLLGKKIVACETLMELCMGNEVAERFLEEILRAASELLNYKYSKKIRTCMGKTVKRILQKMNSANGCCVAVLHGLFNTLASPANKKNIISALELIRLLLSKPEIINFLPVSHGAKLIEGLSFHMANEISTPQDLCSQKIFTCIANLNESFSSLYRLSYKPLFRAYFLPHYSSIFLNPHSSEAFLNAALAAFCDYIELTGDLLTDSPGFSILSYCIQGCYSENSLIRYNSAYGIKVMAALHCPEIQLNLENCINALQALVKLGQTRTEMADISECAALALDRISLLGI